MHAWACAQCEAGLTSIVPAHGGLRWPSYTERSIVIMLALKTLKIVALVGIDLARIFVGVSR